MDFRHTMRGRRALAAVAITTGLVLTVAGCGGGGDDDKSDKASSSAPANSDDDKDKGAAETEPEQTLAEVKSNGITLTVTSAERDEGGFLTVQGKVTNATSGIWLASEWKSDETELKKNGGSLAGASVVDQTGKKKYFVLRDTEGRCLCTKFEGGIDQGQSADWFAQFPAPPDGTSTVQFQVPTMPPASIELPEGE
ncbi:hypothetical protein OG288_16685 [Streptomyces tauricus]|uniref:Lipoprotein n=1 Tax=Streptomyces tauricus TaxID=68274 RepID=A0ABZ1JEG3_9ACTN|nr:hypothetical protein [Streptomyces tauricus]